MEILDYVSLAPEVAPAGWKFRLSSGGGTLRLWAENRAERTQFEGVFAEDECRALIDNRAIDTAAFHRMVRQALAGGSAELGAELQRCEGGLTLTVQFSPNRWETQRFLLPLEALRAEPVDVLASQVEDLGRVALGKWVCAEGEAGVPLRWTEKLVTRPGLFALAAGKLLFLQPGLYRIEVWVTTSSGTGLELRWNGKRELAIGKVHGGHLPLQLTDVLEARSGHYLEVILLGGLAQSSRLLVTRLGDTPC
jgi:hypothetical protein